MTGWVEAASILRIQSLQEKNLFAGRPPLKTQKYSVNQHLIETILAWVNSGEIAIHEIQRASCLIQGSGYQDAYLAESKVSAFKFEADERGTPYVEVDPIIAEYVAGQSYACVQEMFSRMVKSDGTAVVLFPFQRLSHSFIVAGLGHKFDGERERESNNNLRLSLGRMKEQVLSFVDPENNSAIAKANHYIAALDEQLIACDKTDEAIRMWE